MSRHDLRTLLDKLPDDLRRAVALGAYAGLRVSEVAALDWADVDTEARRARIWHSVADRHLRQPVDPFPVGHPVPVRPDDRWHNLIVHSLAR